MAAFCEIEYGCTGRLTINSVPMFSPAWVAPHLSKLWYDVAVRGESTLLPGASGRRSNPTRVDETEHQLPFFINGVVDQTGATYPQAWEGLRLNLDYLWTNVFSPVTTGRGTRSASYLTPGGVTLTADVRVEPFIPAEEITDPTYVSGTFTLIIPAGRFA
jgi:hypothetical protein